MLDRLFDPENRFWTFANKLADLLVLELLCLFCCLPLVTAGAAFSAFWRMALALVRDEEPRLFSGFFRAFRDRFPTGAAAGLTHLALAGFLLLDIRLSLGMGTAAGAFLGGLFGSLLLLLSLAGLWLYPLIGARGLRWREAVVTASLLAVRHLPSGLLVLALFGAALAGSLWVPYGVLFFPPLAGWGTAKVLNRVLDRYGEAEPPKAPCDEEII